MLLALPAIATAQPISPQTAQRLAQGSFREYLELLALPNDAINPPDIQRNVDFVERAFKMRGFTTRQPENTGKPLRYAEWPKQAPGAKTVLYYMHLDGQPVVDRIAARARAAAASSRAFHSSLMRGRRGASRRSGVARWSRQEQFSIDTGTRL